LGIDTKPKRQKKKNIGTRNTGMCKSRAFSKVQKKLKSRRAAHFFI
jgi:hypothetical protein